MIRSRRILTLSHRHGGKGVRLGLDGVGPFWSGCDLRCAKAAAVSLFRA